MWGKKGVLNSETHQYTGKNVSGNSTKIHMLVYGLGNPVKFKLSKGQVHDSKEVIPLLSMIQIEESNVIADKAYGSKDIRDYIKSQKANYVIPPRQSEKDKWECDYYLYKERHLVECFFNKIKHFRIIATRYEKLSTYFIAFIYVACIFILSK